MRDVGCPKKGGHCEVGKSQRPNTWKEEEEEEDDYYYYYDYNHEYVYYIK